MFTQITESQRVLKFLVKKSFKTSVKTWKCKCFLPTNIKLWHIFSSEMMTIFCLGLTAANVMRVRSSLEQIVLFTSKKALDKLSGPTLHKVWWIIVHCPLIAVTKVKTGLSIDYADSSHISISYKAWICTDTYSCFVSI